MISWLGPFCAFASSVTWAIGSTGYSKMASCNSALSVNFARALFSLPLFLLAAFVTGATFHELTLAHLGWFSISVLASYSIGDVLFLLSARSLGVPGALAIASAFPIWTAIASWLLWGETLSGIEFAGLMIAVGGVGTVILNGPKPLEGEVPIRPTLKGVLLAISSSLLWATNSLAISYGARGISPALGNSLRMILGLVFMTVLTRFVTPGAAFLPRRQELRQYWWVFIIEAFLGSYLFVYGLANSPVALGTVLASLAPVISVPIALAAGLEKPSLFRSLGIVLVVLGLCLLVGGKPNL